MGAIGKASIRPLTARRITYAGLALLRFYQVYRAMVRCKVSAIRLLQADSTAQRTALKAAVTSYLDLALNYTRPATPALLITHGLSGSGKSTVSAEIMTRMPAIRLRSDVERKRLTGLQAYLIEKDRQKRLDDLVATLHPFPLSGTPAFEKHFLECLRF